MEKKKKVKKSSKTIKKAPEKKMGRPPKHLSGRPPAYKPEYADLVYKFCLLKATDVQLAQFFGVSEVTICAWKKKYPDFLKSIKEGKDEADARVSKSLYDRAIGYEHEDVDIRVVGGKIVKTKIIKHYPPDPTSMIFWLKNRQKENWRDKHEIGADDGGPIVLKVVYDSATQKNGD